MEEVDRGVLADLVERELTVSQIARELERSPRSIRYWLRRHRLTAGDVVEVAGGEHRRETVRECRKHGSTKFVLEGRGYYRCAVCRSERVAASRRRTRLKLVQESGGKCALCGYSRFVGALHFHHLSPSEKGFGLSWRGLTRSLPDLRLEARKCVLLCSNCHAEVEAGIVAVPGGSG